MPILNRLRKYHDISKGSIYNDTIGFVQQQDMFLEAWHYYLQGCAYLPSDKQMPVNLDKSLEMHNKALEINPNFDVAYTQRGEIFLQLGNLDKAIQDFKISINISPQFSNPYFGISKVYYKQGNFEIALDYSEQALAIQSKSLEKKHEQSLYENIKEHHKKIINEIEKRNK